MAGATKLLTAGGGGVILTPASSIASDVTVNLPVTGVNNGTLVCSDSSGNVGIGVTPSAWDAAYKSIDIGAYGNINSRTNQLTVVSNAYYNGSSWIYKNTNPVALYQQTNGTHNWWYAASGTAGDGLSLTQAMALDSSGNLLVGISSPWTAAKITSYQGAANSNGVVSQVATNSYSNFAGYSSSLAATFYVTGAGQIWAVSTSINGISDRSAKENIQDIPYGLSDVLKLRPIKFDYTEDGIGDGAKDNLGFIAQEVEPILPELVGDSVNDLKSLKMGDMVPVLVKAIQELSAKNDALEARITALEAK